MTKARRSTLRDRDSSPQPAPFRRAENEDADGAPWITIASEPLSPRRPESADVPAPLSRSAARRYILMIVTAIVGATLILVEVRERSPYWEIGVAVAFGYLFGRMLPCQELRE